MRIVWLHLAYGIQVHGDQVNFFLFTADNGYSYDIAGIVPSLYDGDWHNITATYDAEAGMAKLYVDDLLVSQKSGLSGMIPNPGNRDLTIGSDSWSTQFTGLVDNLSIHNEVVDPGYDYFHATNIEELVEVLEAVTKKSIVTLAPGHYGELSLYGPADPYANFPEKVIIKSAENSNPAVFSQLKLSQVSNITFESIRFNYDYVSGEPIYEKPFLVRDSNYIEFYDNIFVGDAVEAEEEDRASDIFAGFPAGQGLFIRDSNNVIVEGNDMYSFHRGGVFIGIDQLVVRTNDVHDMRSDGFDFVKVQNALIEKNKLYDFLVVPDSTDHADMIQFWTRGTSAPSENVVIRGNYLNSGNRKGTQSIFIRNEEVDSGGATEDMFYQNILIEDNLIYNAHRHGITVGETNGLVIRNNTLIFNEDSASDSSAVFIPSIRINGASKSVEVYNNVAEQLYISPSAEMINNSNNLLTQRKFLRENNYIGALFVDPLSGGDAELSSLLALPGGVVEQMGVGTTVHLFDTTPEEPTGYLLNSVNTGTQLKTQDFDASNIFDNSGPVDPARLQIDWSFGDGASSQGKAVSHSYDSAGTYNVLATISDLQGRPLTQLKKTIYVETPILLSMDYEINAEDSSDFTNKLTVVGDVVIESGAARINTEASTFTYQRTAEIEKNREFTITAAFKKDVGSEAGSGRIIYYSGTAVFSINSHSVTISGSTDIGESINLKSGDIAIADANWHSVSYTFSQSAGEAKLYVDGVLVAQKSGLLGRQRVSNGHNFHIGNPFGSAFPGLIDDVKFVGWAKSSEEINH